MEKRNPAVAGLFYPSNSNELREQVQGYLATAPAQAKAPKALIGPHAGTIYSGAIAASAYKSLEPVRDVIKRVILLGPAHRVLLHGLATSSAESFTTPLGEIPLDRETITSLEQLASVSCVDEAHESEHSLELHLPFLQVMLNDFKLVPLVCGLCEADEVATVIEAAWGGPETLIVVSSDLSHYLRYEQAQQIDRVTSRQIETMDWEALQGEQACGFYPLRGLLATARAHHMTIKTIDLRNSGDTAGTKDGVVGYGAYLCYE